MSTPAEASVTIASVRSGMISETAPTNVVLPAPNPPAMTIFVDVVAPPSECASECFKATQRPSYEFVALIAGRTVGQRSMHPKVTGHNQIADQDARDAHRQIQPGRDFGDRRALDAQLDDLVSHVVGWPLVSQRRLQRLNRRFQREVDAGARSVRPSTCTGGPGSPHVRVTGPPVTRVCPSRLTSTSRRRRRGAAGRLHHAAHLFDKDGHLVPDLADIARRHGQRRQMRAVADVHQQQIAVLHLDHRLQHRPTVEQLRGAGRRGWPARKPPRPTDRPVRAIAAHWRRWAVRRRTPATHAPPRGPRGRTSTPASPVSCSARGLSFLIGP